MSGVNRWIKFFVWGALFIIFSNLLIFIGLNMDYEEIQNIEKLPNEITLLKAEATKVNGRIYGKISNTEKNNLNGSYIMINIYDEYEEIVGTKYIEIINVGYETSKQFEVHFKADNVKYYDISIVNEKNENTAKLFEDIFISEDMKKSMLISLLVYAFFFG